MEIDLRIPDDYCQGEATTLIPEHEIDWEEDRARGFKIKPRNRLTRTDD